MQAIERVTLVLRAKPGETLTPLLKHISLGAPVAIGEHIAVIASASDRDAVSQVFDQEFSIDDHARMALNDLRYRWLRDHALQTGNANVPMVRIGLGNPLQGFDLDVEVDRAVLDWPGSDEWEDLSPKTEVVLKAVAGRHPNPAPTAVDPRDLFISANPVGASREELEKGRNGFVDERAHADYLIFLSGFRAAQGTDQ